MAAHTKTRRKLQYHEVAAMFMDGYSSDKSPSKAKTSVGTPFGAKTCTSPRTITTPTQVKTRPSSSTATPIGARTRSSASTVRYGVKTHPSPKPATPSRVKPHPSSGTATPLGARTHSSSGMKTHPSLKSVTPSKKTSPKKAHPSPKIPSRVRSPKELLPSSSPRTPFRVRIHPSPKKAHLSPNTGTPSKARMHPSPKKATMTGTPLRARIPSPKKAPPPSPLASRVRTRSSYGIKTPSAEAKTCPSPSTSGVRTRSSCSIKTPSAEAKTCPSPSTSGVRTRSSCSVRTPSEPLPPSTGSPSGAKTQSFSDIGTPSRPKPHPPLVKAPIKKSASKKTKERSRVNSTPRRGRRKKTDSESSDMEMTDEESLSNTSPHKSRKRKREVILNIPDRELVTPRRKKSKKVKMNKFDAARERLHPSAVPDSLPCREDEFQTVYTFVEEKLMANRGGCMYISGLPGTGKTATVLEVTCSLREAAEEGYLPHFKFVEVNGMKLTEPKQVFVSILEQLTGEKKSPDAARATLHTYFSSSKKKTPTLLFADELDLLSTRKQRVLYEIMSWPNCNNSRLVLLGVANTMDLPDRISDNKKVSTRMGYSRVTFAPYTHQQLHKILMARVCDLELFEQDVIELAVRKVAALSGDIRRALDLLIRAIEIAQADGHKEVVKIPHLQLAIEEMFSSGMMRAVKHCSLYQKLLLRAVLSEFQRSGVEEAIFWRIVDRMEELYALEGVVPVCPSLLSRLCTGLCACRILLVDNPAKDLDRKIRLNLPPNDLKLALHS